MAVLYGRAGRLTAKNGGFRPAQCPDGAEVAFFALMVQEYAAGCPYPNTSTSYISYLDSNQLSHCAGCGAHRDALGADCWAADRAPACTTPRACRGERRAVYQALFVGYLAYLKRRRFERAYIWVMPPRKEDGVEQDYVFHQRPA
jgi:hypothetical protein